MNVHVLVIEHRHGTDVSVHEDEAGARAALYAYVAEWWDEDGPGDDFTGQLPIPEDPQAAISAYFEDNEREDAQIHERPVLGADGRIEVDK